MDNAKTEMLKKLIEMKKELNRKQRKLEKLKRVAHTKAHIREKIRENANLVTDCHTDELPGTRSPSSNGRSPPNNVSSSSVSHNTADSQAKCAVIKQSVQIRSNIDNHDHNKSNACGGIKETYQEYKPVTEDDNTAVFCTDDSCTQTAVTLLTVKHSHDAVDDVEDDHKTQNHCEKSVVDFFAHTSLNPYSDKSVHLSEEAQPVKSLESFETDKGFEPEVALSQLSHMSTESTTAEHNLQTSVFVDCVSSTESEETVVKGTPINMNSLNPHFCNRKKQTSSGNDHLENTSPSTSSFEDLMDQFNSKNVLQTLSGKDSSLIKQETITDSEFFYALDLTQKDGVVLGQDITENQIPNIAEREKTLSQVGNNHDNMLGKSHKSHNLSTAAHVGGMASVNTSLADGSNQQDIAGSRLQVNSLSIADSDIYTQSTLVNSTSSFSEYTELDAIPYSQFELTEDFLSETQHSQESMNRVTHRAKKYGALVKRRSSRLSSFDFTHSRSAHLRTCHLLPHSGSVLSDCDCAVPWFKSKQTKPAAQQTKVAAVLSVFQFLIDEAKTANSSLEFQLPSLYDNLISSRLKCATVSNYFVATHNYAENKENNALETEDSEVKNVASHRFSLKKNIGQPASTAVKRDSAAIEEFINVDKRNIKDAFRADAVMGISPDEVLLESKLCPDNAQGQEINTALLNNENSSSDRNVEKHSLGVDNRRDNLTEILTDSGRSSNLLRPNQHPVSIFNGPIASVRQKRMPIYTSRGKLFHRTFGKSVAKTLFAAKNTSVCGCIYNTTGDRVTTVSEVCSTGMITVPLETTSHRCIPVQESHAQGEHISVKSASLSNRDVVLTKSDIAVTVCDTSTTKLKTLCPTSQCDNVHLQMTTPKLLRQSANNESVLNIHTQFAGAYHALATRSSHEVASPESDASFLYSPNTSANHLTLQTSSEVLSLTSTPKTVAAHRTGCDSSQLDFDISFVGNGKSKEIARSMMHKPTERTEFHKSKTLVAQMQSPLDLSESACTSPGCQVVFPDKSPLSCVHSCVEVPGLHKEDAPEMPTDVSSAIRRSNDSQDNVSHLFVTSSNFISPWKKLPKTASSPVLVLEQNTPGNYQMTPVFSPFIGRSRSKLIHNGTRSQNVLKFSGCFQSCAQDAVVTLLNGHAKTTDQEMQPYIVSVQATSLTVWTEDALGGWIAELDWKLASEMHIMKACLLPRHDSVIAIAASGWNNQSPFATLFLYDWTTGDTTRYNIPLLEQQCKLQSLSQIELCSVAASELDIAVTSDTHYVIGRMLFNDFLKSVECLRTSQVQRGKLLSSVAVSGQASANVSLTADQEITIWNMVLCIAVKKIQVRPPLPCLIRLLTATSHQGILLLDTVWRVDDGDCGGVIAVNPVTGNTQKIVTFTVPNNTWRRIESAQSEASFVTAISDKGSLSIWNRSNGTLLGYTKSKTTTCASITTVAKRLIIGDIHGCLHIYSTQC